MPLIKQAEVIEQFILSAVNAAASAEKITFTPEKLCNAIFDRCEEGEKVLLSLPDGDGRELFSAFITENNVITNPSGEELKTTRTGITLSFAGVASTGSVCLSMDEKLTAPISILTQNHITIVRGDTIVKRPSDLFSGEYNDGKSFSFITGPSATADMGPLVRGVHGPGKLHIIILE
jgi:L-lactate dehydrogenase complex protein LldG